MRIQLGHSVVGMLPGVKSLFVFCSGSHSLDGSLLNFSYVGCVMQRHFFVVHAKLLLEFNRHKIVCPGDGGSHQ